MGIGEFYALGCAFLWALAVLFLKKAGEVVPAFSLNLFKNSLVFLLLIPTIPLVAGLDWPDFSAREYGLLILSGVLGITLADGMFLRCLNLLGAGRSAIISCLYSPFVLILSMIFLSERMTWLRFGGFVLILGGIILVGFERPQNHKSKRELRTGALIGVAAVGLMATAIVMIKPLTEAYPVLHVCEIRLAGGVMGALVYLAVRGRLATEIALFRQPLPWVPMIAGSILGAYLAMLMWLAGFKYADASVAAILNQTSVVWIIVLSAVFLREPLTKRRMAGVLVAFVGVVIIALG